MSRRPHRGLWAARYGVYLFAFISQALDRGASPWRLPLLGAILVLLAVLPFVAGRFGPKSRQGVVLVTLETTLTFGASAVMTTFYYFLLYFILPVDILFIFPLRPALLIVLAAYTLLGVNALLSGLRGIELVEFLLSMLIGYVFVGAATRLAIDHAAARNRAEDLLARLGQAHTQLQAYAAEVETLSVARERQRVAQEVHDSVAHVLTGVLMQVQAVRKALPTNPRDAATRLEAVEEAVRRGLDDIRRAVRALRPEHLETIGGIEAMRRLGAQFAERTGIRVNFLAEQLPLPPAHEVLLYRVLQECLTNAARHGRASTVWVELRAEGGQTQLRVKDDGVGTAQIHFGMGMTGMQERARSAGGRLIVATAPGEGFEAVLELPLPAALQGS